MLGSKLKSLQLVNVRSHELAEFEFNPHVNAIVGLNGSGKTTVLEALYTLLKGNSFRGSLSEAVRWGSPQMKMDLLVAENDGSSKRTLLIEQGSETPVSKKWSIDSKKYARLPLLQRRPVILFEPDLGRMITGSPERRRQYLDNLAAQLDVEVARAQTRFERTLRQRNLLLKQVSPVSIRQHVDQLFVWNTQLANLSGQIVKSRVEIIKQLQSQVSKQYKKLGGQDNIFLSYSSSVAAQPKQYANQLIQFLESSLQRDIALGHTSFGPHRDDLEIRLADQPAKERASRGEVRTIVLALKMLEAEILRQAFGTSNMQPVLLLDDVLSELDLHHQEQVLAGFKDYQVFLTTTDAHTLTPGTYTIALD